MERITFFLTALVAVIILNACSHTQSVEVSPPELLPIAASDNGTTVNAVAGQELVITLDGNPSTGYTWEAKDLDTTMFLQVGDSQFTSANPDLVGSGGTLTLTFRVLKTGNATLTLVYHRPWERDVEPLDSFSVTVMVK